MGVQVSETIFNFLLPPVPDPDVVVGAQVEGVDHVASALSNLTIQFKNKPNITSITTALMIEANFVEAALQQLQFGRTIYNATGIQLDVLGHIVGQPRAGLVDSDYRRYLLARIRTNRSQGTVEDLIAVSILILGDPNALIACTHWGKSSIIVEIRNTSVTDSVAAILLSFLQDAIAAGVRVVLHYSGSVPANTFRFDSGPGLDVGHFANSIG